MKALRPIKAHDHGKTGHPSAAAAKSSDTPNTTNDTMFLIIWFEGGNGNETLTTG